MSFLVFSELAQGVLVDAVFRIRYTPFIHRGIEQLAARQAHNLEVAGSSPAPATKKNVLLKQVVFVLTKR